MTNITIVNGYFEEYMDRIKYPDPSLPPALIVTDPPINLTKKQWKILIDNDIPSIIFCGLRGSDSLRKKIVQIQQASNRELASWYCHGMGIGSLCYNKYPEPHKRIDDSFLTEKDFFPNKHHPFGLPLGYVVDAIWHASNHIDVMNHTIVDPFMGSGTTMVAANMIGIPSLGIEPDDYYFDIANERIEAL